MLEYKIVWESFEDFYPLVWEELMIFVKDFDAKVYKYNYISEHKNVYLL